MARYKFDEQSPAGIKLRKIIDAVEFLMHAAEDIVGDLNQCTNAQVMATWVFSDGVNAADTTINGAAKAEILSDLGKLLTDSSQTNVHAALRQFLDQFV